MHGYHTKKTTSRRGIVVAEINNAKQQSRNLQAYVELFQLVAVYD